MAYIGKQPVIGNFVKLDAISVVNGQASYTMQNGGANFTEYANVNQFLVSLNGILQSPTTSFTVSSSTITFASNLVTGDVIDFIIVLGNTLDVGVPSDNTVSLAKLTATGTKDATTFLRGDNTFAEAGGGKVLQVVDVSTQGQQSTTSTSYVAVSGMTLNITPSSTSSKILLLHSANIQTDSGFYGYFTIYRDSTDISESHANQGLSANYSSQGTQTVSIHHSKLDSPNTTSQITYTVRFRSSNGTTVYYGEPTGTTTSLIAMEIGA